MLFDTHAHLTDKAFDPDREQIIGELIKLNMAGVINCGYDAPSSEFSVRLAEQYDFMFAAVGMHPHDAKFYNDAFEQKIKNWLAHPKTVALGEIGLDFHYDHSPRDVQKQVFIRQLFTAGEFSVPVIIHSREASEATYDILKSEMKSERAGVLHSFSQSTEMMRKYLDLGMYFSISGPVTFSNASNLRETVRYIPADRLFIETDCPYLTPAPYRGKRNNPAYVRYVAEKIGEILSMEYEKVCEITCQNAKRFFGID